MTPPVSVRAMMLGGPLHGQDMEVVDGMVSVLFPDEPPLSSLTAAELRADRPFRTGQYMLHRLTPDAEALLPAELRGFDVYGVLAGWELRVVEARELVSFQAIRSLSVDDLRRHVWGKLNRQSDREVKALRGQLIGEARETRPDPDRMLQRFTITRVLVCPNS